MDQKQIEDYANFVIAQFDGQHDMYTSGYWLAKGYLKFATLVERYGLVIDAARKVSEPGIRGEVDSDDMDSLRDALSKLEDDND